MIARHLLGDAYPIKKLESVVEFLDHKRRPVTESDRKPGPYPYYGANGPQGWIDGFIFDEPLILLAEDGGHFDSPDRGVAYRVSGKTWVNNHAHVLRPTKEVDIGFLCRVLENYDLTPFITGTTRGKLTKAGASEIPVIVPPLEQQRRIAAILDQAETLRTQRRAALAQLDSLTQSIFLDMFGDGSTPEPTIGEMLEKKVLLLHKDGNHGSLYPRAEEFGEEGVPFLSARCVSDGGEIKEQFVDRLQDQKANQLRIGWIEKGDVLLAHNASVGKVALYDGRYPRALIGTSLTAFRADQSILSPEFLAAAFRSTKFQAQLFKNMGQTTRNQVPITAQRELRVALPPLPLQQTFATRIQAIASLKTTHRTALAELDALFASLQQRAFAGLL